MNWKPWGHAGMVIYCVQAKKTPNSSTFFDFIHLPSHCLFISEIAQGAYIKAILYSCDKRIIRSK